MLIFAPSREVGKINTLGDELRRGVAAVQQQPGLDLAVLAGRGGAQLHHPGAGDKRFEAGLGAAPQGLFLIADAADLRRVQAVEPDPVAAGRHGVAVHHPLHLPGQPSAGARRAGPRRRDRGEGGEEQGGEGPNHAARIARQRDPFATLLRDALPGAVQRPSRRPAGPV